MSAWVGWCIAVKGSRNLIGCDGRFSLAVSFLVAIKICVVHYFLFLVHYNLLCSYLHHYSTLIVHCALIFPSLLCTILYQYYYYLIMSSTSWQQMLVAASNVKQTTHAKSVSGWKITAEEDAVQEANYLDISQTGKRLIRVTFKRFENSPTVYICFKVFKRENEKESYIRHSQTSITANEFLLMREKSSNIDAVLDELFTTTSSSEKRRKLDNNGENDV